MGTREQLLVTAGRLIDEQGVHEVGLDVILRETGISKTTFYKYFDSKDKLAIDALKFRTKRTIDAIHTALAETKYDTVTEALVGFFRVWDEALFDKKHHGCIFLKVCSEYPNPNDEMHIAGKEFPNAMEKLVREIIAGYEVENVTAAADKIMIVLQGYASYMFINKKGNVRALAEYMIRSLADMMDSDEFREFLESNHQPTSKLGL